MRRLATILSAILILALLAAPALAQTRYEVKYRVVGELEPGNEVVFQLMMARISAGGDMKPVTDAVFTVVVNGKEKLTVQANEEGVASVVVRTSSLSLLGSTITLEVVAKSSAYEVEASRTIVEHVRPNMFALASVILAALSLLIPLLIVVRRVSS